MSDLTLWGAPLTPAERLWLWRRNRGLTQAQAAERLGCGRGLVSAAEQGHTVLPARLTVRRATPAARLALARRRSGLGLVATAEALGVSRVTLLAMERRADPRLEEFWGIYFCSQRG